MSTYRIFLSSPGDVLPERNRAQAVVQRLNAEHTGEVPFSLTRWEEAFYSASAPFQGQIASAAEHDLVIFIFWKRLGTELPPGFNRPDGTTRTGTEYEFEEAREARNRREDQLPDILVYRKTAKVFFSEEKLDLERAQKKALDQFWQRWFRTSAGHFVAGFQSFGDAEDFERQLERNLRQWLHHRRELKVAWDTLQRGSPYRGLAAFGEDYSTVFFGRDADTARARAKLIEARVGADGASGTPFLLILGPSGSGKSSLLRAGLVPRLRQSGAPGTKEDGSDCIHAFRVLELVPHEMGVDLCAAFAERLCGDESSAPLVLPELRKGDLSDPWQLARLAHTAPDIVAATVVRALDRIEHPRGARSMPTGSTGRVGLLLVIDQLEELFSIPLSIRQPFTHLLRGLAATGRVWIVATMRNDFYDALRSDPELSALADAGRLYDLARPTQADYRTIIRAPAAAAGLVFEVAAGRDLAQEIEDEAQNEGALPVVSFLLEQLFQERRGNVLTLDTYDRLGGAAGALARHGEEVVAHLEAGPRDAIPNVVRRLVRKGLRDTGPTAAAAPVSAFASDKNAQTLIRALIAARLLTTFSVSSGHPPVVTPWVRWSHEALLVRWPRIRELIEVDRRDYETLDRVTSAWSLWAGTPPHQKNKRLLTELALAEGNDLIQRWGIDVDEGVRQFVHASHVHARARQSSRRRLVAGVVLSLAVLTVVASSTALVAYRARNAALIAQSAALRDAATAKEVTGFLVGLFKDVDPGQARGKTLLAREVLDHGLQKIRTDLKNEPAVRAEVLEAIGTVYSNLGLYTAGEAALRESLSLAETSPDSTPLSVANARKALAFAIVDEGKLAEAESLYQLAIDYYDTVPKLRIEATDTRSDLGYAYWSDAKYEKGIEVLTEARNAAIGLTGPSSDLTAGILFTLGQTLFSRGDREQGLKLEIEANRITRQVHGEDYYWYAAGLYEIGFALQQMQRVPQAADYFSRSIPILEKVLGPDHPWLSIALYGYGGVLSTQGKHAAAVAALVRSLAIAERAGVAQSRDADNARLSLAEAYIATGEYARAIPLSQAVVSNTLRREGDNSPEYQAALHNLGVELRRAGHAEAAIPPLRRALELKERLLPGNAWSMRISLGALADALCVKTPNDEGLSLARRARSLDVKDATSWEADIFAAIYAYCDPVATNRKENEQVLLTSLQHVKDARGNNSPQTRDMLFRLMRFYRAAGELGSAGRYQQLLRTAVKQSSAGT